LKLLHINRCPVLAPLNVLRGEDIERLQLDMNSPLQHADQLIAAQAQWHDKLALIYGEEGFAPSEDPEQQLYDGFIGDRDRRLCEQVRSAEPAQLATTVLPFDDARLPELLFRYRARNFSSSLDAGEQQRWVMFCQQRLTRPECGAPNTLAAFDQALGELFAAATPEQQAMLTEWSNYAQQLRLRYSL
jgi:exodeoxyribonuclease-1